jgi:flagellar hook-associated protein 1 FlgK
MGNGFGSLYIGASGLQNAQYALNTTANNLANVNTTGYVRQQVRFADKTYNKLKDPNKNVNMQQYGLGVSIGDVVHARDIFLDKFYRQENGRKGFYTSFYEITDYVQDLFQELNGEQFKQSVSDLHQAFQELEPNMDNSTKQNLVLEKADLLLSRTKSLYDDMKSYQSNINEQIKDDVDRVNKIGNRIYELNLQIQKVEAGGQETAMTLRDERDNLLDELGGYGSVSIKEDATGFTYVDFESTPFIDDNKCYNIGLQEDKETGFYTPYWTQLSDVDKQQYVRVFKKNEVISTDLNTDVGSIKAKLLARGDGYGTYQDLESEEAYDRISGCTMMETEAQVSALLHNIVTKINDAYCPNKTVDTDVTYTDADGNQVSLKGKKVLDAANCAVGEDGQLPPRELFTRVGMDRYTKVTGDDGNTYYVYNEEDENDPTTLYSLNNISINKELRKQITLMPYKNQNGTDYPLGEKLMSLWNDKGMTLNPYDKKPCTFEGYYDKLIGQIGNDGSTFQSASETLTGALSSIDNQRQQTMGVSSDEELTHMIKFQSAYNASSRFMTVISQMTELIVTGLK